MASKTILYYTSNKENPEFENRVIKSLIQNSGGLPIVSITQKPLALGRNICVGDKGSSTLNMFRQILIGAKAAATEYVVFAEADFLYPKEYFDFEPADDLYRYDNVWVVYKGSPYFHQIPWSNGAQIAKREFIIKSLTEYLSGEDEWTINRPTKQDYGGAVGTVIHGKIPCLTFKTGLGLSRRAGTVIRKKKALPHWGTVKEVYENY